jgi:predicted lipid-binding transport protein (Tim44 family)
LQHLDIVFFAIVAVVLGWKLYSILGRRTGHERQIDPFARPTPPDAKKGDLPARGRTVDRDDAEAPVQIGTRRAEGRPHLRPVETRAEPAAGPGASMQPRDRRQLEAEIAAAPESLRQGLDAIRKADPSFNPIDFVGGAKIAFEMILMSFAEGDTKTLQPLLGADVYESFAAAIEERRRAGHRLKTSLVGITHVEIADADLRDRHAQVTLKITSEQIDVTEDSTGQVIDGDPARVDTLVDLWTFARDTTSRDPNWQLVATQSPA